MAYHSDPDDAFRGFPRDDTYPPMLFLSDTNEYVVGIGLHVNGAGLITFERTLIDDDCIHSGNPAVNRLGEAAKLLNEMIAAMLEDKQRFHDECDDEAKADAEDDAVYQSYISPRPWGTPPADTTDATILQFGQFVKDVQPQDFA